jgi:hypothetical protein
VLAALEVVLKEAVSWETKKGEKEASSAVLELFAAPVGGVLVFAPSEDVSVVFAPSEGVPEEAGLLVVLVGLLLVRGW